MEIIKVKANNPKSNLSAMTVEWQANCSKYGENPLPHGKMSAQSLHKLLRCWAVKLSCPSAKVAWLTGRSGFRRAPWLSNCPSLRHENVMA